MHTRVERRNTPSYGNLFMVYVDEQVALTKHLARKHPDDIAPTYVAEFYTHDLDIRAAAMDAWSDWFEDYCDSFAARMMGRVQ